MSASDVSLIEETVAQFFDLGWGSFPLLFREQKEERATIARVAFYSPLLLGVG